MIVIYIFAGLIGLLLVIAALLPKVYNVEKTIVIKKPVPDVMNLTFPFTAPPRLTCFANVPTAFI